MLNRPSLSSSIIIWRLVSSSSKVITRLFPLFSCFFTPLIFFRIELILAAELQVEQPGIVNRTTLSPAPAALAKTAKKIRDKKILNIFFILNAIFIIGL